MPDTLSIELQLEDSSFDSTLNRDQQKLENFGKNVPPVKVKIDGKEVDAGLLGIEKSFSKTATNSNKQIKTIENQLNDLNKVIAQTSSKSILSQLQTEAEKLKKELAVLKTEAAEISIKNPVGSNSAFAGGFAGGFACRGSCR